MLQRFKDERDRIGAVSSDWNNATGIYFFRRCPIHCIFPFTFQQLTRLKEVTRIPFRDELFYQRRSGVLNIFCVDAMIEIDAANSVQQRHQIILAVEVCLSSEL